MPSHSPVLPLPPTPTLRPTPPLCVVALWRSSPVHAHREEGMSDEKIAGTLFRLTRRRQVSKISKYRCGCVLLQGCFRGPRKQGLLHTPWGGPLKPLGGSRRAGPPDSPGGGGVLPQATPRFWEMRFLWGTAPILPRTKRGLKQGYETVVCNRVCNRIRFQGGMKHAGVHTQLKNIPT